MATLHAAAAKQLLKLTNPVETMLEEAVNRIAPLVGKENVFIATSAALKEPVLEAELCSARKRLGGAVPAQYARGALLDERAVARPWDRRRFPRGADGRSQDQRSRKLSQNCRGGTNPRRDQGRAGDHRRTPHATGDGFRLHRGWREAQTGFRAASFREKPDAPTAREFVDAGHFLWNSGMFFFSLRSFLRELESAQPDAHSLTRYIAVEIREKRPAQADNLFATLPSVSVDYAVMEKAREM